MKKILFGAMAAVALLACSKDQVIEQNRANDEISFSVVADNQTKAAAVYSSTKFMDAFKVSAVYTDSNGSKLYFQDDEVTRNGNSWNSATTRYWPNNGTLDFYATNASMTPPSDWSKYAPSIPWTVDETVTKQEDLLYAVANDISKTQDGVVELNFHHALSQIVFKAKNTNSKTSVSISAVKVGQVKYNASFIMPTTSDDPIQWSGWVNHSKDFSVDFTAVNVNADSDSDAVELTTTDNGSMLLIPQTTTAWTRSTTTYDGTYLAVYCTIYNVAGDELDTTTDVLLHDGWAVLPVSFVWEPGKKYVYTFIFGNGNGGFKDNPENPEEVLTPITYKVEVDNFTSVEITREMY